MNCPCAPPPSWGVGATGRQGCSQAQASHLCRHLGALPPSMLQNPGDALPVTAQVTRSWKQLDSPEPRPSHCIGQKRPQWSRIVNHVGCGLAVGNVYAHTRGSADGWWALQPGWAQQGRSLLQDVCPECVHSGAQAEGATAPWEEGSSWQWQKWWGANFKCLSV